MKFSQSWEYNKTILMTQGKHKGIIRCSLFLRETCKWKPIYLKVSDDGVKVPSPLFTTRKKFNWSPSRYTKNVTCLLQEVFSQTSPRLESMHSAISLSGSSIGTKNGKADKQTFNLYQALCLLVQWQEIMCWIWITMLCIQYTHDTLQRSFWSFYS